MYLTQNLYNSTIQFVYRIPNSDSPLQMNVLEILVML